MSGLGRALEAGRTSYGLSLVRRPGVMPKVLGGRLVAQGLVTTWADDELAHAAGGLVDALHALSMLGLAAVSSRRRGEALRAAAVATGFAAAEVLVWLCAPAPDGGAGR